jgi:hypothetical protein
MVDSIQDENHPSIIAGEGFARKWGCSGNANLPIGLLGALGIAEKSDRPIRNSTFPGSCRVEQTLARSHQSRRNG